MAAHDPYIIHLNRQLNFRHASDPTIAYIESERLGHDDFEFNSGDPNDPGHHDWNAFDHHYLRYAQVLDTDYENFAILYSCQEGAHYYHPNDKKKHPILDLHDIWKHVKRQSNPTDSHMQTAYEVGRGIVK